MALKTIIARQLRQPRGPLGSIAAFVMRLRNRELIEFTLSRASIGAGETVLEIGFGPGLGIERAGEQTPDAKLYGVDFSDDMLKAASRRNAALIRAGRVELRQGNAEDLPYAGNTFDKIYTTNTLYFFPDPHKMLREALRVLKPGGLLAIGITPKEIMDKMGVVDTGVFTTYSGEDVVSLMRRAGFEQINCTAREERPQRPTCVTGRKP